MAALLNPDLLAELKALSEKIAAEVVFGEAGTDQGLLPINSLLGQLQERLADDSVPQGLIRGAQIARQWLDQVLDSTGTFSKNMLERLCEWVTWWQAALVACETGKSLPLCPDAWQTATSEPASAASFPALNSPAGTEPGLVLNLAADAELLGEFINESQEHLQNIEQGVLVLECNPSEEDTLNSIFRAFHTFKGGSGFLNLVPIQDLAHELESLLDQARQRKLVITPAIIDLILEGGDTLKGFVGEIGAQLAGRKPPGPIMIPTRALVGSIRTALEGGPGPTPPPQDVERVQPQPLTAPDLVKAASDLVSAASAPVPALSVPGSSGKELPANPLSKIKLGSTVVSVKVDTLKLDSLVDLVGEMVIAQSLVVQNPELGLLHNEQLTRDLAQLGRITKEMQRIVMSLRMVPVRATFQKMHRLVRDSAAKLGKCAELVTEGEETELDRTIVEQISDPLIHMIRNAVDHGIEKPERRRQQGKSETGTIRLRAFHQGGNIVIEIADDGHGLDHERILAKAVEKGLVRAGEQLSENQIFNFIMSPGFSTADKVTDLSGRGVGMDVVRRNIEKLRGKIEIQSRSGQGSTFSFYLPLTLAIIDGLLVGVGDQRFIVPTLLVRESFRPEPGMISTVQGRGEMVNVRGHLLPLLRLYEQLGIQPASVDPGQSIALVLEVGSAARCVLVDKLLGKQEVVIKSLGEALRRNRFIAGAAILGDGRVGLILDPQALVQLQNLPLDAAA